MSGPPPPYPGNAGMVPPPEAGMYPPQEKSPYPPGQPQPCAPPPAGYPQQVYPPPPPPGNIHPPGYGPPPPGYGPPPGMYGPPPPAQPPTLIVQPVMGPGVFSDNPIQTRCPKCNADIMTSTYYDTGTLSWILCLILCFFGFIFGCCLIPFCIDSTKDVIHSCPNCNQQIGRYNRM